MSAGLLQTRLLLLLLLVDKHRGHALQIAVSSIRGGSDESLTIPLPIHMLVTKILLFSRLAWLIAVATCLAPVQPNG